MEDYNLGGDPTNDSAYNANDFGPQLDDYETGSVTHHHSKTGYIVVSIIAFVIVAIWFIIIVITHNEKKWLWNYKRPLVLPGQRGDTIFPTAQGFSNLPSDLSHMTIALGGGEVPTKDFDQINSEANEQLKAWGTYTDPRTNPVSTLNLN
jgi:hypothetical protein